MVFRSKKWSWLGFERKVAQEKHQSTVPVEAEGRKGKKKMEKVKKGTIHKWHHIFFSTCWFCWPLPSSLQPRSKVQLVLFQFSFSCFPTAWVDVIVENLEIEDRSLNKNIKYLIFGSEFGFTGPIRMEKIPHIKWVARFWNVVTGFS